MSSNTKLNVSDNENMCVVCFKNVNIYSIGICDHPVCYECSTRMRVLCGQNECPICRQDMPKVIFCHSVEPFKKLKTNLYKNSYHFTEDRKFGIIFNSPSFQKQYYKLLEHNCKICERLPPFRNFQQLKDHMRREHELHYCDLCVENLRIFTWERKCYTRSELAQHRIRGDSDDTSHRGHPLCKFCDQRYNDSDELFRHLRKDHLFCHFCDADGLHQYYPSYDTLREHFRAEHYLCEEGDCFHEQFTSVFRSEIDLKAHRASIHTKHLSKAATKQARTLELEFTLAPRPRQQEQNSQRGRKPPNPYASSESRAYEEEGAVGYTQTYVEPPTQVQLRSQDFPSLSGGGAPAAGPLHPGTVTIKHYSKGQKALTRNDQNFPALPGDAGTVRLSVNSSVVGPQERSNPPNTPKVSIHVNHSSNGAITTHISSQNSGSVKIRPHSSKEFPSLSSAPVPEVQWVKPSTSRETKPKVNKVAPAPVLPPRNSPVDFPSLNKNDTKNKKTTVTVPVSNWANETKENTKNKNTNSSANVTKSKSNTIVTESKDKSKNKKKKSKLNNNNSENESSDNKSTKSAPKPKEIKKETPNPQQNGVVKKRSELKIDSLQITDTNLSNGNDFPALGPRKVPPGLNTLPPPGINMQPPPGFAANDLTFTNSSGQTYSILPQNQFIPPPNFAQRNRILVEKFMSAINSNEKIYEFKQISIMFRNGDFPSERYYERCKSEIGSEFAQIFPELLVLLPDIIKQQELFNHHVKNGGSKKFLEVCATCNQVVSSNDLRSHLANHTLENHFPALGTQEISSVWRK